MRTYEDELIGVLIKRDTLIYQRFLETWYVKGKIDREYLISYRLAKVLKKRAMIEHAIMECENMSFYEKAHSNKWLIENEKGYKGWK